jgi:hypothetical protein
MEKQRFTRLTVLRLSHRTRSDRYWLCRCDCGTVKTVRHDLLMNGKAKSCGCLGAELREASIAKAAEERRPYTKKSWASMVARCTDPRTPSYLKYGGRGITVCDRWLHGEDGMTPQECFYQDMGPRPAGTSIDRIDSEKGYTPDNCRWATQKQQTANRKNVGRPRKNV